MQYVFYYKEHLTKYVGDAYYVDKELLQSVVNSEKFKTANTTKTVNNAYGYKTNVLTDIAITEGVTSPHSFDSLLYRTSISDLTLGKRYEGSQSDIPCYLISRHPLHVELQISDMDICSAKTVMLSCWTLNPEKAASTKEIIDAFDVVSMACPREGAFEAWKVVVEPNTGLPAIARLLVPEDAERSSAFGPKCRVSKATVIDIFKLYPGNPDDYKPGEHIGYDNFITYPGHNTLQWNVVDRAEIATSCVSHMFAESITYKVGKEVQPNVFDKNRFKECAGGVHCFTDLNEAIDFVYAGIDWVPERITKRNHHRMYNQITRMLKGVNKLENTQS